MEGLRLFENAGVCRCDEAGPAEAWRVRKRAGALGGTQRRHDLLATFVSDDDDIVKCDYCDKTEVNQKRETGK